MKTLAKATLKVMEKLTGGSRPSVSYLKANWQRLSNGAEGIPVRVSYAPRRNNKESNKGANKSTKGGTLTLRCSALEGLKLQHQSTRLLQQVNKELGENVFIRLNITREQPKK